MGGLSYSLSAWLVCRGIALCFALAFLSLLPQLQGLYGKNGILSIAQFLKVLRQQERMNPLSLPSFFWLGSSDFTLNALALCGLTASGLALVGFSTSVMLFVCWGCYLSFVNVGQEFLGFQWDILLLEAGFLAVFLEPLSWGWHFWIAAEPPIFIRWALWLLIFKLMFLSGVVKLMSKDPAWKNLTALRFHFWTQPLPNPVAYFLAKIPSWLQRVACFAMFLVEFLSPLLLLLPGTPRLGAAALLILLQFFILMSGNFAFFNFLVTVLALSLIPNDVWEPFVRDLLPALQFGAPTSSSLQTAGIVIAAVLIPLDVFWFMLAFWEESPFVNWLLPMIRWLYYFRVNATYGLFSVMTQERPELVLEGSDDGIVWREYEFKFKPSNTEKSPPFIAPFQPRLDWQMWFAALGDFYSNLWLQNLIARIFMNSEDVLGLLKSDPFARRPPQYLRLIKYQYRFSDLKDLLKNRQWWRREYVGLYSPVFQKSDFVD